MQKRHPIFLILVFSLCVAPLTALAQFGSCSKDEVITLLAKGFSKTELDQLCAQAPVVDGYEPPAWYVIMGSFKNTEKGSKAGWKLAQRIMTITDDNEIITSESDFYPDLTPDLYIVMKGPFLRQQDAGNWIRQTQVRQLVPDTYIKKTRARILDH